MTVATQSFARSTGARAAHGCRHCPVRERALCCALPASGAAALNRMSHTRRFVAGHVIHNDYLDPNWFAFIISGVVKLVKAQPDGRQQIVGLLFPSDFIGRPYSRNNSLIAEAATDLDVCCFPRAAFEDLMFEYPSLAQAFLKRTLEQLDASREWMFVIGRKTAEERLASLLLLIANQMTRARPETKDPRSSLTFDLPLSRSELADCLGLTIETVSRQIRNMKSQRVLVAEGRRKVTIPCLAALSAAAGGVV